MPELPEVETIRRQLDSRLRGKTITAVRLFRSGREIPKSAKFIRILTGKKIKEIARRAKLLVWNFTDGTAMLAHLKMTGRFVFVDGAYEPKKHDSAMFKFVDAPACALGVRRTPARNIWFGLMCGNSVS